jgi:DNA-binding transcriptional MerR regulator
VSELQEIPDKPFFGTSEVCRLTDTQPYVLRFWESEFPQLAPDRARGGHSMYRRRDIDIVLRIKKLLYEDEFTIEGARKQLEQELAGSGGDDPEPDAAPEPVAPIRVSHPAEIGETVSRQRYDDAVEEIELLRLRLRETEARERRAEVRAERADAAQAADRRRIESALARVERLIAQLSRPPAP